jgi:hypothetical protein
MTASMVDLQRAVGRVLVARDGDEYTLGRPDLGVYVAVPEAGAVFVTALREGAPLDEATARASAAAGEAVDGADFLRGLADAGLLDPPAGDEAAPDPAAVDGRRIRWIEGVSQRTAHRFFGPVAWTGYAAAALFAAGVLILDPDLRPDVEDAWFLGDPLLSILVYPPIVLLLGAAHEAWHWLAGRAVGVPAVFRVSRRGVWLVFETDLTQIVALPRRRRYGPFLAGMALDGAILAVALALRLLYRDEVLALPPLADRVLAVVVLSQVIGLGWQVAGVFLRTDVYAVLANALRCHNLYRATWLTNKDRIWGLKPTEGAEMDGISPHDRRVARWFSVVHLAGMAGVGWLFLSYALPFTIGMLLWVVNNLTAHTVTSTAFWESVAVVGWLVVQWGAVPLLGLRERRMRERGALL